MNCTLPHSKAAWSRIASFSLLPLAAVAFIGCGNSDDFGFEPEDIPDLVLRLDARAIEELRDGDLLGTWRDSSNRGNDATQELGTKRPKYVATAHDGLPAVRFDGWNDVLVVHDSNSIDIGGEDLSILVVYSAEDSPTNNLRLLAKGANTDQSRGYAIMGGNNTLHLIVSNGKVGRLSVRSSDQVVDRTTLVTFVVNRGAQMRAYRDGTPKATSDLKGFGIETWSNRNDLTIGGVNPIPNIPWKGDIMELLIYKRHLSRLERVALETYLADKWAIELEKD